MGERLYRTEALILRRRDLGEADRVLIIATPQGKRSVIAKGVRKTMSRIAGHIELFTHTRLLLATGRNLDVVTQSQVCQRFQTLHADLHRLSYAYYAAELYDQFVQGPEENPPLFRLLIQMFTALDGTRNPDILMRAYELKLLQHMGYRPHLQHCSICQQRLTEEADRFSLLHGGVLCPRDAHTDRHARAISLPAFKLLRYLQRQPFEAIEPLNISAGVGAEIETLLRAYISRFAEREMKTIMFLDALQNHDGLQAKKVDS